MFKSQEVFLSCTVLSWKTYCWWGQQLP